MHYIDWSCTIQILNQQLELFSGLNSQDNINSSSVFQAFLVHLCVNYSKGHQQLLGEISYETRTARVQ